MKANHLIALVVSIISFSIISCEEDLDIDLQEKEWVAVKMKKDDAATYDRPDADYILTFDSDTSLTIVLDVNTCFGIYSIPENGTITLEQGIGCTEACCDSEFAETMVNCFSAITSYYGQGNRLVFENSEGSEVVFKEK